MHLAFYETIAGVIPVLFLALVVEERLRPQEQSSGKWDYLMPIGVSGLLVMAEAAALVAIYSGRSNAWTGSLAANATGLAALVIIGHAAAETLDAMPKAISTLRLRVAVFAWIAFVFGVVGLLVVTR